MAQLQGSWVVHGTASGGGRTWHSIRGWSYMAQHLVQTALVLNDAKDP